MTDKKGLFRHSRALVGLRVRRLRTRLALRLAPWLRPRGNYTAGTGNTTPTATLWFDHTDGL